MVSCGSSGDVYKRQTRIFTEDGVSIPVTVIEVEANRVTQVKANDVVSIREKAKKQSRVKAALELAEQREKPTWLEVDEMCIRDSR